MDAKQLHDYIIVPVLDHLGMDSLSARLLILGTALIESDLSSIRQRGGGPAMGLWQMEPNTHDDIWANWLVVKPDITRRVTELMNVRWPIGASQMMGNNYYACAMARLHYWRLPSPLPAPDNPERLARYYKLFYNTYLGATKEKKAIKLMKMAIALVSP